MLNLVANGPSGYNISNSLRFRGSASAYLSRTPASASNQTTWTLSVWIKRGILGTDNFIINSGVAANSNTNLDFSSDFLYLSDTLSGTTKTSLVTTQVFRDPSAWYHIVLAYDSTQATASNRVKIYVNGSQVTSFQSPTYPALNATTYINSTNNHRIGNPVAAVGSGYFDGYMSEFNFIDGQALTPSSFGSTNATTGVWQPARYTGSYGTNGFYLNFSSIALTSGSNTGLGKDYSGNGNYWNTNNISVTAGTTYDAMTDVPTNTSATVANYATFNPLNKDTSITVTDGNLAASAAGTNIGVTGSIAISSGKWYWEITQTAGGVATSNIVGITDATLAAKTAGLTTNSYGYGTGTTAYKWNAGTNTAYGSNWTNGDVISVAFDADAGTITFYKNNVSQGTAFTGISGTFYPAFGFQNGSAYAVNFGQRPFSYTPPTGFVRLNTYNLPTPTILQGNKYMDATIWTGTGSAATITNAAGFKPDFVWIKQRSSVENHQLVDTVRGYNNYLNSNLTNAESTSTNKLTTFNSNGFGIGTDTSVNANTSTYVGWQWQAGQGSTSSNTSGSITSTVSVNTTAGFSVVTYTGTGANATVGHGLGVAPSMIIIKSRNTAATSWNVYHTSLGNTKAMFLNLTDAAYTNSAYWNNTSPTSTVFSLGGANTDGNGSGRTLVAYCWAEIAGFSKFGSYTGNGSADGPFVYTGFRPKYVMIKSSSNSGTEWLVWDATRNQYNSTNSFLYPNQNYAEYTGSAADLDFLSNGFKFRNANTGSASSNQSGYTYIFAAFAENPTKFALAR